MICDTNWCTFCDRAVNPHLNAIYCSEECFQKDAKSHLPIYATYPFNNQPTIRRSESSSSICSDDLVAIHLDLTNSLLSNATLNNETPCTLPALSGYNAQ